MTNYESSRYQFYHYKNVTHPLLKIVSGVGNFFYQLYIKVLTHHLDLLQLPLKQYFANKICCFVESQLVQSYSSYLYALIKLRLVGQPL